MCLRKLLVILLFLLVVLLPLYSDRVLTEEEYQAVMIALETSETALQNQEKSIARLEAELKQLKTLQEISEKIISQQSIAFAQLEKSLKEQRKEQTITRILDHLRGFVGGYFTREYQSH